MWALIQIWKRANTKLSTGWEPSCCKAVFWGSLSSEVPYPAAVSGCPCATKYLLPRRAEACWEGRTGEKATRQSNYPNFRTKKSFLLILRGIKSQPCVIQLHSLYYQNTMVWVSLLSISTKTETWWKQYNLILAAGIKALVSQTTVSFC